MSIPHPVGIHLIDQKKTEEIHPDFLLHGLLKARAKTIALLEEIKKNLREGINEIEARSLALEISKDHGVNKHWHQPYIRFGKGTSLSFHEPLQSTNTMCLHDPYYLDLGPVWFDSELGLEYEGDYGNTFVFGENQEAQTCIEWARKLFQEAKEKWLTEKYTGVQIYQYLRRRCGELGYTLMEDFDGHRLSDFPHHKYTTERLAQVPFIPSDSFWVLELQINDSKSRFGAFYEDILS